MTQKDGKGDKSDKTRRNILMQVAGGAAALAGGMTSAQARKRPAQPGRPKARAVDTKVRKILAVAVGKDGERKMPITKATTNTELDTVRPYIKGLIQWLKDPTTNGDLEALPLKFELGDGTNPGYTIDYREIGIKQLDVAKPDVFSNANLQDVDCIVCMSTFVGEKAADATTKPIVVITSDPSNDKFGDNVCGVCAIRPHLIGIGLRKFRKFANVNKVHGLHRDKYKPSKHAKKDIGKAIKVWVSVDDGDDDDSILTKIKNLDKTKAGLLVLPADRFFGLADEIVAAAKPMPTYWTTTDWPKGSAGGYGFSQAKCGQYMGQRVASIWSSTSGDEIPEEPFLTIELKDIATKP